MRIPPDRIDALLASWPVARLATLARDGRPAQVPIVFARAGDALWSPVDAKPKRGGELERVRNLRRDPRASLLLDHYDADWSRLWWIRVRCDARVYTPAAPERDADTAPALAALRRKYPQYRDIPILRDPPTLLCLPLAHTSSWCAGAEALRAPAP